MIIYRPRDAKGTVSRDRLKYISHQNPDGFGLMWSMGGRLITARYAVAQRKAFVDRFMFLQAENVPVCAHCRWSTHGSISRANTHPFSIVQGESAMMHNGVFNIKTEKMWSDTRTFVELVLRRLPDDWATNEAAPYRYLINQATYGSKMAVMFKDGSVVLFHESAGRWVDEIWYSNDNYQPITKDDKAKDDKAKDDKVVEQDWNRWISEGKGGTGYYSGKYSGKASRRHGHHSYHPPMGQGETLHRWSRQQHDGEVEKLFIWEQMILCEDCVKMEVVAQREAVELAGITSDDFCELCGSVGKATGERPKLVGSGERRLILPPPAHDNGKGNVVEGGA